MIRMTPMTRMTWDMADGREALELIKQPVPHSGPERNLLTLRSTAMILDISRGLGRGSPEYYGTVPTKATNARMWSMRAGGELTVSEMAKLMGHALDSVDLRLTTEPQMRHMLEMSMHVATAGFALAGLMASVGADT